MRANNVEQEAKHIHACMFSDDLFIVLALLLSCSLVLSYSKYALFLALVLSLFSDNSVGERERRVIPGERQKKGPGHISFGESKYGGKGGGEGKVKYALVFPFPRACE